MLQCQRGRCGDASVRHIGGHYMYLLNSCEHCRRTSTLALSCPLDLQHDDVATKSNRSAADAADAGLSDTPLTFSFRRQPVTIISTTLCYVARQLHRLKPASINSIPFDPIHLFINSVVVLEQIRSTKVAFDFDPSSK